MEKRMYERVSIKVKLTYELKNRPKILKDSESKDISGGGICLSLKERLLPKTQIAMRIDLGDNSETLNLDGTVVWNRRVEIAGKIGPIVYYDTGIEFNNADPINVNKVITYFYGKSF